MKFRAYQDSVKQKEIIKAVIFLTIGGVYIGWNLGKALIAFFYH